MLTKVEARNSQGQMLTLPIDDVEVGYPVQDIEGLDPVKATLVFSSFAGMDGSQFQKARRENRNIVISLGIEPDYAFESVSVRRTNLYTYFMPKEPVWLRFYEDSGLIVDIQGIVEILDAPRFTKAPSATITIVCSRPDFVEIVPVQISGNTTSGLTETIHQYEGTVETGFTFRLTANRNADGFVINHKPADDTLRLFEFVYPLVAGDVVNISTVSGNKSATLTRNGTTSSVLFAVSPKSEWINFFRGTNKLRVFSTGNAMPYILEYTARHGGL